MGVNKAAGREKASMWGLKVRMTGRNMGRDTKKGRCRKRDGHK